MQGVFTATADLGPRRGLMSVGNIKIDLDTYRVTVGGKSFPLSPQQFDLLILLASNTDRVLSRQLITTTVWGEAESSSVPRRLNLAIHRLRAVINLSGQYQILTVRNRGYGLCRIAPT